jgi:tryptophanyl-tRNA synthetase
MSMKPTARRWKILKTDTCNAFAIYLLAKWTNCNNDCTYGGNYGYGHAKQACMNYLWDFKTEREKYKYYMNNLPEVDGLWKLVLKKLRCSQWSARKSSKN